MLIEDEIEEICQHRDRYLAIVIDQPTGNQIIFDFNVGGDWDDPERGAGRLLLDATRLLNRRRKAKEGADD